MIQTQMSRGGAEYPDGNALRAADAGQTQQGAPSGSDEHDNAGITELIEHILRKAEELGRKDGFEEGYRHALKDTEKLAAEAEQRILEKAGQEAEALRSRYAQACSKAGEGALGLGMEYARRLVQIILQSSDEPFMRLCENAASHIGQVDQAILHAGPLGCRIARRHEQRLKQALGGAKNLEIRQSGNDDGLCLIETPYGSADASVNTQLSRAAQALGYGIQGVK